MEPETVRTWRYFDAVDLEATSCHPLLSGTARLLSSRTGRTRLPRSARTYDLTKKITLAGHQQPVRQGSSADLASNSGTGCG